MKKLTRRSAAVRLAGLASTAVLAAGALAAGAPGAARAQEEIRIGVLSPLTGPAAKFGEIQRSTLTIAAEDVNNAGGIQSLGGAQITLVFGDTRGEPDMGVTEAERLITSENVHAIVGAFQSGVTLPSSAVAERYQIPWVNFSTVDKLTERGFRYFFRAHANDTIKARTLIEGIMALAEKGGGTLSKGVILAENTEWGKGVSEKQKRFLEENGVTIDLVEFYPYAAPDLTSMVVKAKGLEPDLVLADSYLGDALLITRLMGEHQLKPVAYAAGGGGHIQPDFLKGAGPLAEGLIAATAWDPAVGLALPWIKDLNERHVERFGVPMTEDSAAYYQAFQVIVDALERIDQLDTEKLRDAIAATDITDQNHPAMVIPYKRLHFDETGQNPDATAMVVQVQ
ncbi:MAG TPA: ABC transporter substrate-binding protein, partial [Geminicoccaceae bacterium]|nr:ABC transporter substrate-binding protein [Geminicoccaceae bacterium]